jgi:hypothetical protein
MGDEVVNKYMRNSYLDLHVIALLGERNPCFMGSPSKGNESFICHLPQVPWKPPYNHLYRYLGNITTATNSQFTSRGVQSTVGTEHMGRIKNYEDIQED